MVRGPGNPAGDGREERVASGVGDDDGKDLVLPCDAGDPHSVVVDGGGGAGHIRSVPIPVAGARIVADQVVAREQLGCEIGMSRVDARVENGDHDARAPRRDGPGRGGTDHRQVPLVGEIRVVGARRQPLVGLDELHLGPFRERRGHGPQRRGGDPNTVDVQAANLLDLRGSVGTINGFGRARIHAALEADEQLIGDRDDARVGGGRITWLEWEDEAKDEDGYDGCNEWDETGETQDAGHGRSSSGPRPQLPGGDAPSLRQPGRQLLADP